MLVCVSLQLPKVAMYQIYRVANRHNRNADDQETKDSKKKAHRLEPDDIGIAGVRQLMDPSYNLCEKCFWLCALLLCCGICLYQAITLTLHYLSNPIAIEIQIIRNDTISLPAITICPVSLSNDFTLAFEFFRQRQCKEHGKEQNCSFMTLFQELNITLEELWQENKVTPENFEINSTCGINLGSQESEDSVCHNGRMKHNMHHKFVKTVFGTCLYSAQRKPFSYKGPDTYISFKSTNMFPLGGPLFNYDYYESEVNAKLGRNDKPTFFESYNKGMTDQTTNESTSIMANNSNENERDKYTTSITTNANTSNSVLSNESPAGTAYAGGHLTSDSSWKDKIEFAYFLHEPGVIPRHDASYFAESVFKGYFTELRISVKEYRYLNTKANPCTDVQTFTECRDNCLDKKLQNIVPCSFPFLKASNKKVCINSSEFLEDAYRKTLEFYRTMKLSDCDCKRKCTDVIYSVMSDVVNMPWEWKSTVQLSYPINIYEVVIENHAYSLESLLSDIAGSIGFYMGVCILSIVEIVNNIVKKKILARFQRQNNDVELGPTRF